MTKSELIEALAQRANLTQKRAEDVINTIFNSMTQAMINGERIEIRGLGSFKVVAEAENGAQAVALARATRPDVILMDIVMPDVDGVQAIRQIIRETPAARVIALTMYRQEGYMLDAIRAGARGYLLKTVDAAELIAAIEAVHRGDYLIDPIIAARVLSELHLPALPQAPPVESLTEGEMAVLRLVAQGVENKEIAGALNYSVYTVANRLRTIYQKLHVSNRTQAALYALRQGWVTLDEPRGG